jgi:hypothetical protein
MKRRVLITCSSPRGVPYWWFSSYDKTLSLNHPDYDFEFAMEAGHNAINLARNIAAKAAIDEDYWKIVQIDTDQFWEPHHLVRLVSHDEDIVGALYCKKHPGKVKWVAIKKANASPRGDGLLAADYIGTGMFCTTIAALKKIVAFFPEREFLYDDEAGNPHTMTELFPIGLVGPNTAAGRLSRIKKLLSDNRKEDGTYSPGVLNVIETILTSRDGLMARLLGEDYWFCHLARKAGIPIWLDTKCIVGHVGDIVYPIGADIKSEPEDIPIAAMNLDEW